MSALLRKRVPLTAAVTIDSLAGEGVTLKSVMDKVSKSVSLVAIRVSIRDVRKTKTGGILFEVDTELEARTLAKKLRSIVGTTARVTYPSVGPLFSCSTFQSWLEKRM